MSRLFLIRHGQASFLEQNYDKLSTLGEKQACLLGEHWARRGITFHRVFTGPRSRQAETARRVGDAYKAAGLPFPEIQEMNEFDEYAGDSVLELCLPAQVKSSRQICDLHHAFVQASSAAEKHKTFQRLFEVVIGKWVAGEIEVENVESWAEFSQRVNRGLSQISETSGRGEDVAIFTSGGPVAVTMQRALRLSPETTLQVAWMVRNCAYSEFLFSGGRFTLSSFNSFPHLDDSSLLTYR